MLSPMIYIGKFISQGGIILLDNIERIAAYIADGAKCSGNIGVELEHFIIRKDGTHVSYHGGVKNILDELSEFYSRKEYSGDDLVALYSDDASITIEPAGQIEISIKPCSDIAEILKIYDEFRERIEQILKKHAFDIVNLGYSPLSAAADMELIPKKRYEFMDKYFRTSGRYGMNMMRATASTQCSVDYSDEADCRRKMQLAYALTPILALITDNSPIFEGRKSPSRMMRTVIWNDVDRDRCGIVPGVFSPDFGYMKYAEYIYNSPAILIIENGIPKYTGSKRICDIYENKELTNDDIEHLLSMFFPDVRLKQYIEIRPADCMKREHAIGYAALIKSLFTKMDIPDISLTENDVYTAKLELIKNGSQGIVYGRPVKEIINAIFKKASEISGDDAEYIRLLYDKIEGEVK